MSSSLQDELDKLLAAYTSRGSEGVPHVSLIVTRSTGDLYVGASGVLDLAEPQRKMTPDTVVWIANMSKAITSVAALICIERGLVGLDDDLAPFIPELRDLKVVDREMPFEHGEYTLQPASKEITLRHMLTHSSGLIFSTWYKHSQLYAAKRGIPEYSDAVRDAFQFPSWHVAGMEWHYGMGVDYAGLLVEILTGQRLSEFMDQNIFKPLKMASTSFSLSPEMAARKSSAFERNESGKIVPAPSELWKEGTEQDMGGGGLWSTAADYAKFLRMLLNDGKSPDGVQVIKAETIEMCTKGHLEPSAKKSCNDVHQDAEPWRWPGVKRDHSLIGMVFEENLSTGRAAGSVQWDATPSCLWFIDRKKDIGLVQCAQIVPAGDPEIQKLLLEIEKAVYNQLDSV